MVRYQVKYGGGKSDTDYRSSLEIYVDGKQVDEYWDGGEPEDNTFFRDWSWIQQELENAYKLGLEHGSARAFEAGVMS